MNIKDILMNKATQNQLAHFYILESSLPEHESYDQLMSFVHDLIRDYYQKIEGAKQSLTHLMDHPDVFVMGNHPEYGDKKDPNYIVEEAEQLIRFFEMKPIQGKRKFAVIPEGHKITSTVANKWLKLLEEPNGLATIFLLNPRRQKLLDTIHSRAQHLRLPVAVSQSSQEDWLHFVKDTKGQSLATFIEKNIKQETDVFFWTQELINWEALQGDHLEAKLALGDWIKKLQEMETFHQPAATKWSLFYSYLHQYVLPRL
jgi:hypothetical protein